MSVSVANRATKLRTLTLAEVARIVGGATPSTGEQSYWEGEIAWATPKDLSSLEESFLRSTARTITREGLASCAAEVLPAGSVLFSSRAPIGLTAINSIPMATNQGFKSLIPRAGVADAGYLYHWLRANRRYLDGLGNGATFKEVSKAVVSRVEIPIPHKNGKPDTAEQMRIAANLDKADAIRRKRQDALRLTDDFLRSVFLEMFGDPVTNPKGWEITTVGDQLEFLTSGSRGWAQYYADEGDLFIRIQNLRGGLLDLSDAAYVNAPESAEATRTRVREGDVLLSITADLGRTAVVPPGIGKAHINQHIAILRLCSMNPDFVAQLLASPGGQRQFESLNKSAVKAGLNFDDIRSIKLLNPPLELQTRFATIVDRIIKNRRRQESAGVEASDAFTSLQQRAFRGEL